MEEEKIEGLPDVDLSAIVADLKSTQDKDQKVEPKVEGKPQDLGQFKTTEDLLKSYKEIQAAFTRVSQDNKTTREQLAQLNEQLELAKLGSTGTSQVIQNPNDDPEIALEQRIQKSVATQRVADVLEEEAEKNKDQFGKVNVTEFNERYAYAQMVAREYPQLSTTSRGVKKLFELGDKLRTESLRKNAGKALESIFGEPLSEEEINKLRTLVKGDKAIKTTTNLSNAYMPDTSTSTKLGSDQNQKPNNELQIKELVEKGDVDGVINALIKRRLAE